ncbi:MAG: c-type cytochrome domain-containing protein [Vicinamibacteraceae bacterium]
MSELGPQLAAFVGRFHPLLVHFPIAFLLLAGALELLALRRRTGPPWLAARFPLLVVAALVAAVAATAGYLLGASGGYGGPTFERHLQLGIVVAIGALITALAAWRRQRTGAGDRVVGAALALTLIALTGAGHLGATLTHGEGYLTEFAPAPLLTLFGGAGTPAAAFAGSVERAPVFPALVQPVLQRHCVSCHAPGAARGGLVLDTPDAILKGGDHGPVITPGRALASELVRRVWLPPDHPDAMPPRGQRPLPAADASVLRWWIDSGASFEQPLGELEVPPDVLPVVEARLGPLSRGGPTIPAVSLAIPDARQLAAIRDRGIDVRTVADGSPFLQVRLSGREPPADDGRVASLGPIAPHVLWLTVADTAITDAAFPAIAKLTNLTRLDVSRTAVTDRGLQALAPLAQLESLNAYGTPVTDAGLASLATLPRLRRVYLWQTAVTPAGVERLRAAAPKLEIVLGDDEPGGEAAPTTGATGTAVQPR